MNKLDKRNQNKLLAVMPKSELRRWQKNLELMDLPVGTVLHEPGELLQYVYFPTTAIVTLHYELQDVESAHFAMVGHEGVVGTSIFMGSDTTHSHADVQIGGQGYRLPADVMKSGFLASSEVMQLMLRYTHALMTQMSRTAVCNQHHLLEQRLCRWLLLSLDRVRGKELDMTQQQIAGMLGVRRSGVTLAAHGLQESGLISYRRGRIAVLDRTGLERLTCECYQAVKGDYARLLPDL